MPNEPRGSLPSQMISAYASIQVPLMVGPPVTVSVQRYACQHPGYGTGQTERMQIKDRLLGAIGGVRGLGNRQMTPSQFVGVFSGKGTIADIARCLSWMSELRIFHHIRSSRTDETLPMQTRLQRVCDDYIGLDCNGFVGNWAIYNRVANASASHAPLDWLGSRTIRTSIDQIAQYDVVVWAGGTHIGMVEFITSTAETSATVSFAESSRGGMLIHAGTTLTTLRAPQQSARGNHMAHFRLDNDIHRNDNVVIASMARR
jgi:hypothetical protein